MAANQPQLVEAAPRRLGATATEMRAVNAAWQRRLRSPRATGGTRALRTILGEPLAESARTVAGTPCRIRQWQLPLWPDLRFEALVGPGDAPLTEMLVRGPGSPAPQLESLDDLTPWSCVISDVERAFPPVRH